MAQISISRAARALGRSRSTLYRKINEGQLSVHKQGDGSSVLDMAELVRVFGEPVSKHESAAQPDTSTVDTLKEQLAILREQLQAANEREKRLMDMIDKMPGLLSHERPGFMERIIRAFRGNSR